MLFLFAGEMIAATDGLASGQPEAPPVVPGGLMGTPLIRIEDLFVSYGSPSRAVLAGIDLEIAEGEVVCVLGPTGRGKSTPPPLVLRREPPPPRPGPPHHLR